MQIIFPHGAHTAHAGLCRTRVRRYRPLVVRWSAPLAASRFLPFAPFRVGMTKILLG